jgi:hypothetical protein
MAAHHEPADRAAAEAQHRELHSCAPEYSHFHRRSSACASGPGKILEIANYPSSPLSQKKSTLARADEDDPLGPLDQTDGKLHAPRARRFL